jgi:hypothetical protein
MWSRKFDPLGAAESDQAQETRSTTGAGLTCHTERWRTHRPDRHTARNQSRVSDTEPASPSTRRATASDLPGTPSVSRMSDTQPTHNSPMIYDLPRNTPPNQRQTFDMKFRGATHKSRSAGPCMSFNIIRSRYVVHPSLSQKWFQLAQPIKLPVHEWLARRHGVGGKRDVVNDGQRTERGALRNLMGADVGQASVVCDQDGRHECQTRIFHSYDAREKAPSEEDQPAVCPAPPAVASERRNSPP